MLNVALSQDVKGAEDNGYNARLTRIEARLALLEAFRDKEAVQTKMKEQAAQQQAGNQISGGVNLPSMTILGTQMQDGTFIPGNPPQQQAQPPANLYAPLRNDTRAVLDLAAFVRRLLDPHDLGWAVSTEVRSLAFEALGLTKK